MLPSSEGTGVGWLMECERHANNDPAVIAENRARHFKWRSNHLAHAGFDPPVIRLSTSAFLCGVILLSCLEAHAESGVADFTGIARKNAFRLNPPKLDPKPEIAEPATLQVTLRGVSSLCSPQAVLGIQTKTKPASAEEYCVLAAGQTHAGVTVRRIDMESGTVWLTNLGVEQMLTLRE
jgi:hypothetical protein